MHRRSLFTVPAWGRAVVLPVSLLMTVGAVVHAAPGLPSPKTMPKAKSGPATVPQTNKAPPKSTKSKKKPGKKPGGPTLGDLQPVAKPIDHTLDPAVASDLSNPNKLNKAAVAAVASRFAIDISPADVLRSTSLTVRRPYRREAYMSFPYASSVRAEVHPDGHAQMRLVRGQPNRAKRVVRSGEVIDYANAAQTRPFHPSFPANAEVTIDGAHLALHFKAAANRDYVVSCRIASRSAEQYGAVVLANGDFSSWIPGLVPDNGRISFAIPGAASRRGLDIQLISYKNVLEYGGGTTEFDVSRCDITPLR